MPDPDEITWAQLQELFDDEPPAGPLFEERNANMNGMVKRVEDAANKAIRAAIAAGQPQFLDLSMIIPEGWEYEVVEACDRPPQVAILRTS